MVIMMIIIRMKNVLNVIILGFYFNIFILFLSKTCIQDNMATSCLTCSSTDHRILSNP